MLISIITVVKDDLTRLKKTISSLNYIYNDKNFEHVIIEHNSKHLFGNLFTEHISGQHRV